MKLIVSLLCLALLLASVWALFLFRSNRRLTAELETYRHRISKLEIEQQQQDHLFLDLRAERHDLMKHITALQYLLEQSNAHDAQAYLQQLVSDYDSVSVPLKGEQAHLASFLHYTMHTADSRHINVSYDLEAPLTQLPLSMTEQSILVGNLLLNSLDAALAYSERKQNGFINVSSTIKGGLFILKLSNSSLPIEAHILDHLFSKQGLTSKQGKHQGLGASIVARLVKQKHGFLDYWYLNETFTVKVKLPIIKEENSSK